MASALTPSRAASVTSPLPVSGKARIDSIDLLRGIVMVLMVIDHARDYALASTLHMSPTDLTRTTVALFYTRWITHFCAPVFVLLAGTGAYLQRARGQSPAALSRFLLTRGLWLVVLEFTILRVCLMFDFNYGKVIGVAEVIWAIGCSMILLAAFVRLPATVVGGIGLVVISFHNTLDAVKPAPGLATSLWTLVHGQGMIALGTSSVFIAYSVLPWFGVMAAGYGLGIVYDWSAEARQRFLMRVGVAATAAFMAIRFVNAYGDPNPWTTVVHPVLSFLNTTKYPPSLDYLLMTLGPALIALALFERIPETPLSRAAVVLGRVPLFFYVLQWPIVHTMALVGGFVTHRPTAYLFGFPFTRAPEGAGFTLPTVYLMWLLAITLMYPLCAWYGNVKRRHRDWWWLSYL